MATPSYVSAAQAVARVRSGWRVFVHGAAATPSVLLDALVERAPELEAVETIHLHLEGDAPHAAASLRRSFRPSALFCAANLRGAVADGTADYTPVFLSEVPLLFRRQILPLDAALLHVSPPDRHGFVTLGTSVDAARAAADTARTLIGQVNRRMPRTHGDGAIHVSRFAALVEVDQPLPEHASPRPGPIEEAIGRAVAGLVDDGATLQVGIGAIPDAVLGSLRGHQGLGLHSEMIGDGVLALIERGVVTNQHKRRQRGRSVTSFALGSRRLYDFLDDNPSVEVRDCGTVNDAAVIREMPRMTAINSAIEVDLTGQVVADSIGERIYSGVGGQVDFIRGATLAEGGKAIIALPSRSSGGQARIVANLRPGAGVVTTRAHVHHVVTEYGVANLYGRSLRERARALIGLAHPDDREALERAARARFGA
jgi:acyl-CoA hydrolase